MPTNNKPNRLIAEKSTYFTSHAHNPVDWFHGEKKPSKKRNAKTSRLWSALVIQHAIGDRFIHFTKKGSTLNYFNKIDPLTHLAMSPRTIIYIQDYQPTNNNDSCKKYEHITIQIGGVINVNRQQPMI